jgi:hypothetical protein
MSGTNQEPSREEEAMSIRLGINAMGRIGSAHLVGSARAGAASHRSGEQ